MKKWLLFFLLLFVQINVYAEEFPTVSSKNIFFYDLDRKEVLYDLNAEEEIAIASLTKIMTASVALDYITDLDDTVTITAADFKGLYAAHASLAGFDEGETVTYRDLLYGLLLPSGAEAALALSNHLVGSEKAFVEKMNAKAKSLGLEHTHFVNTTGLDEDNHYSTLKEVAIFLEDALSNPEFKTIFTTKEYVTSDGKHTFKNTVEKNAARFNLDISYIQGSKTGYTDAAGLCLASLAEHEGEHYLLITALADYQTGRPEHVIDSEAIYRYFFNNYEHKTLLTEGEVITTVMDENGDEHNLTATQNVEEYLEKESKVSYAYDGNELLNYGMKKGEKVGVYRVLVDNKVIATDVLYLDSDILAPMVPSQDYSGRKTMLIGACIIVMIALLIKGVQKVLS